MSDYEFSDDSSTDYEDFSPEENDNECPVCLLIHKKSASLFIHENYRKNLLDELYDKLIQCRKVPMQSCFKYMIQYGSNYFYMYDKEKYSYVSNTIAEMFIELGFIPNKNDIIISIKQNVHIDNIDRFGIEIDNDIIDVCVEYNFFPVSYEIPKIKQLEGMCKHEQLSAIKKYVKKYKLIPNEKCMVAGCKRKKNINQVLSFLISKGGEFTNECARTLIRQNTKTSCKIAAEYLLEIVESMPF